MAGSQQGLEGSDPSRQGRGSGNSDAAKPEAVPPAVVNSSSDTPGSDTSGGAVPGKGGLGEVPSLDDAILSRSSEVERARAQVPSASQEPSVLRTPAESTDISSSATGTGRSDPGNKGQSSPPPPPPVESASTEPKPDARSKLDPFQGFSFDKYDAANLPPPGVVKELRELYQDVLRGTHNRPFLEREEVFLSEVASGYRIPIMVRDGVGRLVAHMAVINCGDGIVKFGFQLAHPDVRGNKIGAVMRDIGTAVVRELVESGIADVLRAECVTTHPATQKHAARIDMRPTGLLDRRYQDYFGTGGIESLVRMETILNPAVREHQTVFLPASLQVISDYIYQSHRCARTISTIYDPARTPALPAAEMNYDKGEADAWKALTLNVNAGVSIFDMRRALAQSTKAGLRHLAVSVDLGHPHAIDQINALRIDGFYFAALELKKSGDSLLMQKPLFALEPTFADQKACGKEGVLLDLEETRTILHLIRASQFTIH